MEPRWGSEFDRGEAKGGGEFFLERNIAMIRNRLLQRNSLFAAILASCALAIGGAAMAQESGQGGGNYSTTPNRTGQAATTAPANASSAMTGTTESAAAAFRRMDINSTGYLTREQAQASGITSFEAADLNHDGQLSFDEFVNAWNAENDKKQ